MARRSGAFLNISSLPSPYGIGDLGSGAYKWVDRLSGMGFSLWQVLPMVPVGEGNSPYASPSAFAGNMLYISPQLMYEDGLITAAEAEGAKYPGSPYKADYAFAEESKRRLVLSALARADRALLKAVEAFGEENAHIRNYALFAAIKEAKGGLPFWEWGKEADFETAKSEENRFREGVQYRLFAQYLFFSQWERLKKYANTRGVKLFGDMPIYVSRDSADLWENRGLFEVDGQTAKPAFSAGVPPDYFSKTGQLWGNPLYNWDAMRAENFAWWKQRFEAGFKLYDVLRVDHFRAFASYYAVPAGAESAAEGEWRKGPGMELFKAIGKQKGEIIAEDLGVYGEDVEALLEETGFPRMRVIQFGFDPGENSAHLPHNYRREAAAYVGTHDNNTILGWLWEATPHQRQYALEYCGADVNDWGRGGRDAPACRRIIEAVWRSVADTAMISFQDMCGYGADTRLNTPGVPTGNWEFRATEEAVNDIDGDYFRRLNKIFKR